MTNLLETEKEVLLVSPNKQCAIYKCKVWVGIAEQSREYHEEWVDRYGIVCLDETEKPIWGEATTGPARFDTPEEAINYAEQTIFPGWTTNYQLILDDTDS